MAERDLIKISRMPWLCTDPKGSPTDVEIQDGCLMRIADAEERKATAAEKALEIMEARNKPVMVWRDENMKFAAAAKYATEAVERLERENRDLKNKVSIQKAGVVMLYRRISALKGVITKMKDRGVRGIGDKR